MAMAVESPSSKPGGAAVLDKETERVRKRSPRYKVLLHNDPVNSMEYVVATPVSYTHLRAHETS
mgnify:CR=1 FL=1